MDPVKGKRVLVKGHNHEAKFIQQIKQKRHLSVWSVIIQGNSETMLIVWIEEMIDLWKVQNEMTNHLKASMEKQNIILSIEIWVLHRSIEKHRYLIKSLQFRKTRNQGVEEVRKRVQMKREVRKAKSTWIQWQCLIKSNNKNVILQWLILGYKAFGKNKKVTAVQMNQIHLDMKSHWLRCKRIKKIIQICFPLIWKSRQTLWKFLKITQYL